MTAAAWEHLVRDVLPRIEAEQQLSLATAVSVPHMSDDVRRDTLAHWQNAAITLVRQVVRSTTTQATRLRSFLRRGGIDPDTGTELR
jgi:hypothetical protein